MFNSAPYPLVRSIFLPDSTGYKYCLIVNKFRFVECLFGAKNQNNICKNYKNIACSELTTAEKLKKCATIFQCVKKCHFITLDLLRKKCRF